MPGYRIGRYPVTQAQFAEFLDDGGYGNPAFWPEARDAGVWRDGAVKVQYDHEPRSGPEAYRPPFGLPNHPVVGVSWYEALAFTRWLTERWRGNGLLSHDGLVTLPSEAEWEKAARGSDGRSFPWGTEPDPDRANYDEANIGTTSPVGAFPGGASLYGAEELTGNVWEWTRSCLRDYPYDPADGREHLDAPHTVDRVLRGGSYYNTERYVRCAYRNRYDPDVRLDLFGFRVVASPFKL